MTLSPLSMWNILNVTMSLCHHVIFWGFAIPNGSDRESVRNGQWNCILRDHQSPFLRNFNIEGEDGSRVTGRCGEGLATP